MVKELYLRHSFLSRPNRVQDIERSELMLKWEETGGGGGLGEIEGLCMSIAMGTKLFAPCSLY